MKDYTTVIRMGAAYFDVTVNEINAAGEGQVTKIDLRQATKAEQHKVRRLIVAVFEMAQEKAKEEAKANA